MKEGYLSEGAVLSAEMITAWKRKRGIYNFETLPRKAIITLTKAAFEQRLSFRSRKIKGITGTNYIDKALLFSSGFGNGAPALITLMEELRALGVAEFIFIGLAGAIDESITSGTAFYVNKAISANGITATYFSGDEIRPYNQAYVQSIADILQVEGITCFSTDSPFRGTPSLLKEVKQSGCGMIEMECAAVYAFAQFYRLNAICLLVAADKYGEQWQPPTDMEKITSAQKYLVKTLVKNSG